MSLSQQEPQGSTDHDDSPHDPDHDEEGELSIQEATDAEVEILIEEFNEIKEKMAVADATRNPVGAYIAKAGETPLLTREEELILCNSMAEERRAWRSATLRNPYVQNKILQDLRLILQGEKEIPGYVEMKSPTGENLTRRKRIEIRMPHLEACTAIIDSLVQKRIEAVLREGLWDEEDARLQLQTHESIAVILEEVSLEIEPLMIAFNNARKERLPEKYTPSELPHLLSRFRQSPEEHREGMLLATCHFNKWQEARSSIVNANLRLVISIAKKYLKRRRPFLDLIQDGNMGLMRGVDKFNPDLGNKVSTYATWWIHQKIRREAKINSRPIRLPEHMNGLAVKIYEFEIKYAQQHGGGVPDNETIAEALSETPTRIACTRTATHHITSTDRTIGEDDCSSYGSMLEEKREISTLNDVEIKLVREAIRSTLLSLPERDQVIAIERFGLGFKIENTNGVNTLTDDLDAYGIDKTLVEVAESDFSHISAESKQASDRENKEDGGSVTRERIRQLEEKIFKKFYCSDHPMRAELYRMAREFLNLRRQTRTTSNGSARSLPEGNDPLNPALQLSLAQFSLPTRILNAFEENNIFLVKDILTYTNADLFAMDGIADNSIYLVDKALQSVGLVRNKGTKQLKQKRIIQKQE